MVNSKHILKIGLIGPECSGKTSLCNDLSTYFNEPLVEEYARVFLEKTHGKYSFDDLEKMSTRHWQAINEKSIQAKRFLFIDTELINFQVWYEWVFGTCPLSLLQRISKDEVDVYLLTYPDIVWQKDELREYEDPHIRKKLFHHYLDYLTHQSKPWFIIDGKDRTEKAIHILQTSYPDMSCQ